MIRYLFRVIDSKGKTTENSPAVAKHREVHDQREVRLETRTAHGLRTRVDDRFVAPVRSASSALAGKVDGSINGRACELFALDEGSA